MQYHLCALHDPDEDDFYAVWVTDDHDNLIEVATPEAGLPTLDMSWQVTSYSGDREQVYQAFWEVCSALEIKLIPDADLFIDHLRAWEVEQESILSK